MTDMPINNDQVIPLSRLRPILAATFSRTEILEVEPHIQAAAEDDRHVRMLREAVRELRRAGEGIDHVAQVQEAINRLRLKAERAWEAVQSIDHDERRTITEIWKVVGVAPADSEVPLEELVHQIKGNAEVADQVYTELRDAMRVPIGEDARKVAANFRDVYNLVYDELPPPEDQSLTVVQRVDRHLTTSRLARTHVAMAISALVKHLALDEADNWTLPVLIDTILTDAKDDDKELQEKSDRANQLQQRIWDAERRLHHLLGGEGDADAVPLEHALGAVESVVRSHTAAGVVLKDAGQGAALSLATGIADLAQQLRDAQATLARFEHNLPRADAVAELMSNPVTSQVIQVLSSSPPTRMEYTTWDEKGANRRRLVVTLS